MIKLCFFFHKSLFSPLKVKKSTQRVGGGGGVGVVANATLFNIIVNLKYLGYVVQPSLAGVLYNLLPSQK